MRSTVWLRLLVATLLGSVLFWGGCSKKTSLGGEADRTPTQAKPTDAPAPATSGSVKLTLHLANLNDDEGVSKIEGACSNQSAILNWKIDRPSQTIVITYESSEINKDAVIKMLTDLGFEVHAK